MKKIKFALFLILTGTILVSSCEKDNDSNNNTSDSNYFSIDETKYTLDKGYLVGGDGMIYLVSENLTMTSFSDAGMSGIGNVFVIENAGPDYPIAAGTYSFEDMEGAVIVNWNWDEEPHVSDYKQWLGEGFCTINFTGLNYSIDAEGTLADGKSLVVKFTGNLVNITN